MAHRLGFAVRLLIRRGWVSPSTPPAPPPPTFTPAQGSMQMMFF